MSGLRTHKVSGRTVVVFRGDQEAVWAWRGGGVEALRDRRLVGASHRAAPVDEVLRMVDKDRLTQFGRAMMQDLDIDMIPAYSPEARGRSERAFRTHQDRLVKELALAGITEMGPDMPGFGL